ncbi:MAG: hypothetical protein IJZ26_01620 [Clostridia bacterium]|nr:hypothetical protein [Clostridia bacterium]
MSNITNFKHNLQYYLNLIDHRTESGDLWGALDASRNAKQHSKTRIERQGLEVVTAQCYFNMELHSLACRHFFRAVKIPHLRATAYFGIGRSLIFLNQLNLALSYFDACLNCDTNNIFTESILQWTEIIKEKLKSKISTEKNIIATAKNLINRRKFFEAREMLEPLAKQQNLQAKNMIGLSYYLEKNFEKARQEVENVLFNFPFDVFSLCLLYDLDVSMQESIKIKLENVDTIDTNELIKLGLFFASLGDFKSAIKYFDKLIELKEYIPKVHLFSAICAYNLKDTEKALYNISRAKWLDCENTIYTFYYDIFRKNEEPNNLKVYEDLPLNIKEKKLENVTEALQRTDFCWLLNKSHFLLEDLEYATFNEQLCNEISLKLSTCKGSLAKDFFDRILLSVNHTKKHKFLMCKNALFSGKYDELDLVCNYKYISFYFSTKKLKAMYEKLKKAVCNAVAYVYCYDLGKEVLNGVWQLSEKAKKLEDTNITEDELTCLLLSNNTLILQNSCLFFNVSQIKVIQFKNMLKLIKTERSFL